MNKSQFNSIKKLLKNRRYKINATKIWRDIHAEYGVGQLSSKAILFIEQDFSNLRTMCQKLTGVDPLLEEVKGDRLDVAAKARNEKWAQGNVFGDMVEVNSKSSIELTHGQAVTPPGTFLKVGVNDFNLNVIDKILLIENAVIARHWYQCRLPDSLDNALMVYRGHDVSSKAVRAWLTTLPEHIMKIGYFDFDPAGLGIAHDYGVDALLVPDPINDDLISGNRNKPEEFVKQINQRPDLESELPASLSSLYRWMRKENRQCAVTQEKLTAIEWSLKIVKI